MPDLPREILFRSADFVLRAAPDGAENAMPLMSINFARFGEWTEIDSWLEGHFLESFDRGAFAKTFKDQRASMRSIFQHGRDPVCGFKPLGAIEDLREEPDGAWGDVQLLDAAYVREIEAGLRENLYGASFQFKPIRVERNDNPGISSHNPGGIPEVRVKECMVREFGPVTFPQYENTSASLRSLTDDLELDRLRTEHPDRLLAQLQRLKADRPELLQALLERADLKSSDDDDARTPDASTSALNVSSRLHALQGQRQHPALTRALSALGE